MICFNRYTLMSTCISAVVAQAQVLAEKAEEQLAIPLDEEEGLQDEDEMYKNLLAAVPAQAPAQRDKQHVPRQLPPA